MARTEAGENQMTDMNKVFLRVTDAGGERKHHHLDIEHQGHLKVAWEKHDNLQGEMEKTGKKTV